MKHKFKVGDRVQFKSWEELKDEFGEDSYGNIDTGDIYFSFDMKPLCNTYATIIGIRDNDTGEVELDEFSNEKFFEDADNYHFRYLTNMLKPVKKDLASEDLEDCVEYGLNGCKCIIADDFVWTIDELIKYHEEQLKKFKAQKEKEKWVFTEDEKVILRNLPKEYKYIARDAQKELKVFVKKPIRIASPFGNQYWSSCCISEDFSVFNHWFKCIQWTDTEPCEFRKYI